MSRAYPATVRAPSGAQWWRWRLRATESVEQRLETLGSITVCHWILDDDLDEAYFTLYGQHFATGELPDVGPKCITRTLPPPIYWDVLTDGKPTTSDRWLKLTEPGSWWHPDAGSQPYGEWVSEVERRSDLRRAGRI